ncbi:MAG: hypothetical protein [Cressdnaviricota sp.]|nr:MAG: hypothetical protein [Cressdnaviricota sp.]
METMVSIGSLAGGLLGGFGAHRDRRHYREQSELDRQRDRERNERNRQHQTDINRENQANTDRRNQENRDEQRRINQINREREDSKIQRQIADGRLAGLSPLAAMGNAGFSPSMASIGGDSSSYSSPESNQAPSRYSPTSSSGASLAGDAIQSMLQNQQINQQIMESRSRTLLNEANAQRLQNNPMQDGGLGQPRHEASTIWVHPEFGKPYKIPNPELYETSTNEGLTGAYLHGAGRVYSGLGRYITQSGIHLKDLPRHMRTKVEDLKISGAKRQQRINKKLGR